MRSDIRVRLSVMMFLQYFVWGMWFVTLGTFLDKALKFSGTQIGMAYNAMWIAAIVSPFFVGMIADRFFATEKVLAVLHLVGAGCLYWASVQTDFPMFFAVLLLHGLCFMPTLALTNSISLHQMTNPEKEFPGIRVLGTIGWIVAGILVGKVLYLAGEGLSSLTLGEGSSLEPTRYPLVMGAAIEVLLAIFCLALPHTPPQSQKHVTARDILGLDALELMRDRSFAIFVIGSFLVCIPLQFYYAFTNPFLNDIGVSNAAFKQTFGQMSEIIFMLLMPLFFTRLGVKWMLLVGIIAWVTRYFLFSTQAEALIVIGLILHGICYDFFFVTGQIYVDKKAPNEIRAKAQGFLALVTLGAGQFIGALLGGIVKDMFTVESIVDGATKRTVNWGQFWLVPAFGAAVVLVLFGVFFQEKARYTSAGIGTPTDEFGQMESEMV